MKPEHSEPYRLHKDCELRLGTASWDTGRGDKRSIKFTWFDKLGRACRGGEVPVEALTQMVKFAVKKGYLKAL